jgi:L-ascorbate metabolism protein UlaG (beta-lactamase superfamily)
MHGAHARPEPGNERLDLHAVSMKNLPMALAGLASVALSCATAPPAAPRRPPGVAEGQPAPELRVRWLGGPTATLERGALRVLTDPMLGPRSEQAFTLPQHPSSGVLHAPIARYTSLPAFEPQWLSAILISHTHNDHFDVRAKQLLPKQVPVVVTVAGAELVRAAGFSDVRPLDWGESLTLLAGGVELRVLAVPARHAHDPQLDHNLGRGNGYVLDFQDARGRLRAYWTGDAVLSDESRELAAKHGPIDVLLPHLGGVGGDGGLGLRSMNAAEAVELTERVAPRLVLPIHHTTFGHYREPIVALQQRAAEAGLSKRFRFLQEGETFDVR